MQEDPSFTARYPREQPVTVRIVMKNGVAYDGSCVVTKGEPANPHKPAELTGKFFELGAPVWGQAVTQELYDGLMRVEELPDFSAFAETFNL